MLKQDHLGSRCVSASLV